MKVFKLLKPTCFQSAKKLPLHFSSPCYKTLYLEKAGFKKKKIFTTYNFHYLVLAVLWNSPSVLSVCCLNIILGFGSGFGAAQQGNPSPQPELLKAKSREKPRLDFPNFWVLPANNCNCINNRISKLLLKITLKHSSFRILSNPPLYSIGKKWMCS